MESDNIRVYTLIATGIVTIVLLKTMSKLRSNRKLPPGPKGYPIIGNLFDIPKDTDAPFWAKHRDLYGPISSVSVFGKRIIIINELKAAIDLLDKKSAIYSDRPSLTFCGEMIGWTRQVTLMQHDDPRFRKSRKYMFQSIGSKSAAKQFSHILELETHRFLRCVLNRPQNLKSHTQTWAGAAILHISYGYNIKRDGHDPLISLIEEVVNQFSLASRPGAWLVDTIPLLRYVPEWLASMNFKRIARQWRHSLDESAEKPLAFVKEQMVLARGSETESVLSTLLKEGLSEDEEIQATWAAHAIYSGGSDTTVSSFYAFFLAMILFPQAQKRAQEELDNVIGFDRLPRLEDRERLPYINALIKELLRWHPVAHLGIPHVASEDNMYGNYFIPKGALLLPNIWHFNYDPKTFSDPELFRPERYIDDDSKSCGFNPYDSAFGFGRRICPGKELADASLFIAVAMSLAVFNISKGVDENGEEITPSMERSKDLISHIAEFNCRIGIRSARAKLLVETGLEDELLQEN